MITWQIIQSQLESIFFNKHYEVFMMHRGFVECLVKRNSNIIPTSAYACELWIFEKYSEKIYIFLLSVLALNSFQTLTSQLHLFLKKNSEKSLGS